MALLRSARKMKRTLRWSESRQCRNLQSQTTKSNPTMEARILRLAWGSGGAISTREAEEDRGDRPNPRRGLSMRLPLQLPAVAVKATHATHITAHSTQRKLWPLVMLQRRKRHRTLLWELSAQAVLCPDSRRW